MQNLCIFCTIKYTYDQTAYTLGFDWIHLTYLTVS